MFNIPDQGIAKAIGKWARRQRWARNLPLFVLAPIGALSLDAFSGLGIFQLNTATVEFGGVTIHLAALEAASSVTCSMLALIGSMAAAALLADPRKEIRQRAPFAAALALMLTIAPINYLGASMSYQKALSEHSEYANSKAEANDLLVASKPMDYGEDAVFEARENLKKSSKPLTAPLKYECYAWAAFLYAVIMLATGAFWRPAKETPAQETARIQDERSAKSAATRERNRLAKLASEAPDKSVRKQAEKQLAKMGGVIDLAEMRAARKG